MPRRLTPHIPLRLAELTTGRSRTARVLLHVTQKDGRTRADLARMLGVGANNLSHLAQVAHGRAEGCLDADKLMALAGHLGLEPLMPMLQEILIEGLSDVGRRARRERMADADPDLLAWTDALRDLADSYIETVPGTGAALASEIAIFRQAACDRLAEQGEVEKELERIRDGIEASGRPAPLFGPEARQDRAIAEAIVHERRA